MMSGSADRRQHMMLWRRAILAASLALTLVLVMHLNSEGGHEFERENTIIGGPEEGLPPSPTVEEWTQPGAMAGDPPQEHSSSEEGARQAKARLGAMKKLYPQTWSQGAATKAYPYPEDGQPPPKHKSAMLAPPPEGPLDVDEATARVQAAVGAAKEASSQPNLIPNIVHRLGQYERDLAAPVPVPESATPTVPTPPDGYLTKVLPVPANRRAVSVKEARLLRQTAQAKMLASETSKAVAEWTAASAEPQGTAGSREAASKELSWKPAYRRAQEQAAKQKKALELKDLAAQKKAEVGHKAAQKAKAAAAAKAARHAEKEAKHEAALTSIKGEFGELESTMHTLGEVMPMDQAAQDEKTAKATAKRGAEVQAQTAEWAQEKARTEAALASAAQAKAEQQRSQQAALDAQAEKAIEGFRQAATQSEQRPYRIPSPAELQVEDQVHQASTALKHSVQAQGKAEAVGVDLAAARKKSLQMERHAAKVYRLAADEHEHDAAKAAEFQRRLAEHTKKVQEQVRDESEAAKAEAKKLVDSEKANAVKTADKKAQKEQAQEAKNLAAATEADEAADATLSEVKQWKKARAAAKKADAAADHTLAEVKRWEESTGRSKAHQLEGSLIQVQAGPARGASMGRLERIIAYEPEAKQAVEQATSQAVHAKEQAVAASHQARSAMEGAIQGLVPVQQAAHSLDQALQAAGAREPKSAVWSVEATKKQLLQHAYTNAKAAFDGTTPVYDRVQRAQQARALRQKQEEAHNREEHSQEEAQDKLKARQIRIQHKQEVQARALAKQAQATQEAQAVRAANAARRMRWEARQAHQARVQASRQLELTEANRQLAALKAEIAAMSATPEEQPEALAAYAPQLEEAVLKGASMRSISHLMRSADRSGQRRLDPAAVAKNIQAAVADSAVHLPQDPNEVTQEELHAWSKMGHDLDAKFISDLKDSVKGS